MQLCVQTQISTQNERLWISQNLIYFKYNTCLSHTEINTFLVFSQAQESKKMCLENTLFVLPLSMQRLNEIAVLSSAISWHRLIQMDGLLWSLIVQKPLSGMLHERKSRSHGNPTTDSNPNSSYLKSRTFRPIMVNFNENSLQYRQILRLSKGKYLKN